MKRLTLNKNVSEMGMVELAHNSCYARDGAAWYRDYSVDMDARKFVRKLLVDFAERDDGFTCDEDFDDCMAACLEDGYDNIEGLLALFYRNLWAQANLYERLKCYENLEEQGLLLKLPCKVGDTVYFISERVEKQGRRKVITEFVDKGVVDNITLGSAMIPQVTVRNDGNSWIIFDRIDDFGKTVFFTQAEAKKQMEGE